jgi:hypothetical protein
VQSEIVAAARSLVGIRYRHQGRNRLGLDCIGVPALVGLELGFASAKEWLNDPKCKGYGREPDQYMLLGACERYLKYVFAPRLGDIYLMQWENRPRHFGVIVGLEPTRIVHAYAAARKVCESGIDGEWRHGTSWNSLIHSCWRYLEVV